MISASFSVLLKVLNTVPGSNWNLSHKPEYTTPNSRAPSRSATTVCMHLPEALFQAM